MWPHIWLGLQPRQLGTNNAVADCISQFPNHNNTLPHFLTLSQDFPQLQQCRCFHPSAKVVSTILDELLLAKLPDLREASLQRLPCPTGTFSCLLLQHARQWLVHWPTKPSFIELLPCQQRCLPHPREDHLWYHCPIQQNQNFIHAVSDLFPAASQHAPCSFKTDFVDIIVHTLWNYKSLPEHCNMITNEMTMWMAMHIPTLAPTHPFVVIFDWIILGCYAGFCTLEWCQVLQHAYKSNTSWPLQPLEAFSAEDFEFFLDREIPIADINLLPLATVASVHIWWQTQKSKQNGEKIPFFCDSINPQLCPIAAAIHIVWWACSLHANPNLTLEIHPNHNNLHHCLQYHHIVEKVGTNSPQPTPKASCHCSMVHPLRLSDGH